MIMLSKHNDQTLQWQMAIQRKEKSQGNQKKELNEKEEEKRNSNISERGEAINVHYRKKQTRNHCELNRYTVMQSKDA